MKNSKFEWSYECEKSFQVLKNRLVSTLVLTIFSSDGGYVIYSLTSAQA